MKPARTNKGASLLLLCFFSSRSQVLCLCISSENGPLSLPFNLSHFTWLYRLALDSETAPQSYPTFNSFLCILSNPFLKSHLFSISSLPLHRLRPLIMYFRASFSSSSSFFMFFLLFAINGLVLIFALPEEISGSVTRLELIHRNSPKLSGSVVLGERPKTQMENIKQFHRRDVIRIRNMVSRRRRATETASSVAMPIHSGSDYGAGEYFVHVKVGTPGQRFMLVADTGSELTWMNCRYKCGRKCGTHKGRINDKRVFKADRSSSFRTVPCLSGMCKIELANLFSLTSCPTPLTPCAYDYRYLEGSAAIGFFANETVSVGLTNGRKRKLKNVLIGCTQTIKGDLGGFKGADGVLGLGFGKHTFTTKVAEDFGGKFSYCLVDHLSPKNLTNYIVFGHNRIETSLLRSMHHTNLILGGVYGPLYGVNVLGITIGSKLLKIAPKVWDANLGGGTILDSGTSLTYLAEPAYLPVTAAFNKTISKFERLSTEEGPFEFCFNSTGFNESLVPKVLIHFANGALFEPPVKSYILDVAPQKKCLGFVSAGWPGTSIIGNIMQQNHLWEFDLERSTLAFAPSSCT
ncbi:aspartic proteinase NANA, chloroplast-like [Humulus lupulus]|uniref:aspartic proteinase NANA, chloroplast-like n=1 Tax=Humulus lupulus TaxID=3486 RepID=UPI002B40713D|nr:aspartic proteinase NANA, chloroplast-like [Humulus lupulus]